MTPDKLASELRWCLSVLAEDGFYESRIADAVRAAQARIEELDTARLTFIDVARHHKERAEAAEARIEELTEALNVSRDEATVWREVAGEA